MHNMIKHLSKCVREYKKNAILTPILVVCEVILEVMIPFLMASIIDKGIEAGDLDYTLKMGLILTVVCIFSLFFGVTSAIQASIASTGFAANLRHDLFKKVQTFSFYNIDKFSSASIVTRLTTDITNIQMSFQMLIRIAVRSPVTVITASVMAATINTQLALIFLCVVPVLLIALGLIIKTAMPIFQSVFKAYDSLNLVVQENLRGIRVVKVFVRDKHETEKFEENSSRIYKLYTSAERVLAFNAPVMQFCSYTCILLIAWFGSRMIVDSGATQLTTGQLTSLITYALQILMSLMMVSMVFVMMTISRASAARAVEILSEEPTIVNPKTPLMRVKNGDIDFKNVSFSYSENSERYSLKNVDISIKSGETIGIIGGTGSAKSTLVSLIPRLYDVNEGAVLVGDNDVRDYDIETLRDAVAMVLQKNELFSGTISENLRWGNENASDEELVRVCKIACAHEFISTFPDGYNTHIEQGGSNVSGGQKQRICIARALLKNPQILILDDSTSAVDTSTDAVIRTAFREQIPNITKLIIAQRISSVQDADKIIVMDNGEVADFGSHDELIENSNIYREVFESQIKGGEDDE